MICVKAAQHIYGNVEAKDSPRTTRGFQTLYYTRGVISEEVSQIIENYMVYYFLTPPVEKELHFRAGPFSVVTRISPVDEMDRFGRKGKFVGHSLVLTAQEYFKINANPFVILDRFKDCFVTNTQSALAMGDRNTADLHETELVLNDQELQRFEETMSEDLGEWPMTELKRLIKLAFDHRLISSGQNALALCGKREDARRILKGIFSCLPTIYRFHLAFDTHFSGCNLIGKNLWAVRFSSTAEANSLQFETIDLTTRKFTASAPTAPSLVSTPFTRWAVHYIDQGRIRDLVEGKDSAFYLERLFSNGLAKGERPEIVSQATLEAFVQVNRRWVEEKLLEKLEAACGHALSQILSKRFCRKHLVINDNILPIFSQGLQLEELIDLTRLEMFARLENQLSVGLCRDISRLIANSDSDSARTVRALLSYYTGNYSALELLLNDVKPSDYARILESAFGQRRVPLKNLICAEKVAQFLDALHKYRQTQYVKQSLPEIVDQFIAKGLENSLTAFSSVICTNRLQVTAEEQAAIVKIVQALIQSERHKHLVYFQEFLPLLPLSLLQQLEKILVENRLMKELHLQVQEVLAVKAAESQKKKSVEVRFPKGPSGAEVLWQEIGRPCNPGLISRVKAYFGW